MELFTPSPNHPLYMLSTEGRVFSKKRWRFLKQMPAKRGFIQVSMDGKNVTLHKEMAEAFAPTPVSRVWFKNGDKNDCRFSNLDWAVKDIFHHFKFKPKLYIFEDNQFKPYKEEK